MDTSSVCFADSFPSKGKPFGEHHQQLDKSKVTFDRAVILKPKYNIRHRRRARPARLLWLYTTVSSNIFGGVVKRVDKLPGEGYTCYGFFTNGL